MQGFHANEVNVQGIHSVESIVPVYVANWHDADVVEISYRHLFVVAKAFPDCPDCYNGGTFYVIIEFSIVNNR
jgi:hypothetical protein